MTLLDDDSAFGGDPEADSGVPGDELFFQGTIDNDAGAGGSQTDGLVTGLLKAEDIENSVSRSSYEFALAPDLTPLTSNLPELITYQRFVVNIGGPPANDPPASTVSLAQGTNPTIGSGGAIDFMLDSEFDPEGDDVFYSVDLTNDGTFELMDFDPAGTAPPSINLYSDVVEVNTGARPNCPDRPGGVLRHPPHGDPRTDPAGLRSRPGWRQSAAVG